MKRSITRGIFLMAIIGIAVCFGTQFRSRADGRVVDYSLKRDTDIEVNKDGELVIERTANKKESMSDKDSWTLFIYMTGSDLESEYESATKDIKEMFAAKNNNDNLNVIIQTGGCGQWHTEGIEAGNIGRYRVKGEKLEKIESINIMSMGRADTLYDFLNWGVSNYPAKHMGLVFWNHGSGITNGLCVDTIFDDDSLSLGEVEYALAKLNKNVLTDKFEMIGFDTCLSGSLEYANVLAPYARYMVASADVEPNDGWYYKDFIEYIDYNVDANGGEVGEVIVNSYENFYKDNDLKKDTVTLATYNLSKVDEVCVEINRLGKFLVERSNGAQDIEQLLEVVGATKNYEFGCVDIGSIVASLKKSENYNTNGLENALKEMVVHNTIGKSYIERGCNGITIYAPFSSIDMKSLNICRNSLVSPYWLNIVEATNFYSMKSEAKIYGKELTYKLNNWQESQLYYEDTFEFIKYENVSSRGQDLYDLLKTNLNYVFAKGWNTTYKAYKNAITQNSYPSFGGGFGPGFGGGGLEISRNLISAEISDTTNVENVYTSLYIEKNNKLYNLGESAKTDYNKDTGSITAEVLTEWFVLSDGQYMTTNVVDQTDEYVDYGMLVLIDGVESTIRIREKINGVGNNKYEILGIWDAIETSLYAPRGYLPLSKGLKIRPIYNVYDNLTKEKEVVYGDEYVVNGSFDIELKKLDRENSYTSIILDCYIGSDIESNLYELTERAM